MLQSEVTHPEILKLVMSVPNEGPESVEDNLVNLAKVIRTTVDAQIPSSGIDKGTQAVALAVLRNGDPKIPEAQRLREYIQAARTADMLTAEGLIEDVDTDEARIIMLITEALEASLLALKAESQHELHNVTHLEGIKLQNRVLRSWMHVFISFNESFHHSRSDILRLFKFLVTKTRFGELYENDSGKAFVRGLYAELMTYLYVDEKHKKDDGGGVRAPSAHEDIHGATDLIYEDADGSVTLYEAKADMQQREHVMMIDVRDPLELTAYINGLQGRFDAGESRRRENSARRFAESVYERDCNGYIVTVGVPEYLR